MKNNTKKQDIIKAYAKVIETKGIEGASLGAVAKALGINQSLIFHYFENKDDLTCQLTEQVANQCIKSYDKGWPENGDLTKENFEKYVTYILEIHQNRANMINPKLYFTLIYLLPRKKEILNIFIRMTDAIVEKVEHQLSQFATAGIISPVDPKMSARTLLCMADGLLCYWNLTPINEREALINTQKELFYSYVS